MISIIICSVNPALLESVKENIRETIGTPYEIIAIDNSTNRYSICQAYNLAANQAQYPLLCFMHEDISFETSNWGAAVARHLSNPATGLLGVAGGDCKSLVPSSWSVPMISNQINLVQHYKRNNLPPEKLLSTDIRPAYPARNVVVVDGVWLCTRKDVFNEYQFDEKNLTGFHGYDIDFSLQVNTRYQVLVVFDVLLHHYSEGTPDKNWVHSAELISRKWKQQLPVSTISFTAGQYQWHHWHSMRVLIGHLSRLRYRRRAILATYLRYSCTRYFSLRHFISLGRFVATTIYAPGRQTNP